MITKAALDSKWTMANDVYFTIHCPIHTLKVERDKNKRPSSSPFIVEAINKVSPWRISPAVGLPEKGPQAIIIFCVLLLGEVECKQQT